MVPVKKIVLITTGQPSVNPRIVKEADALSSAGHHVTMLYCHWIPWADEADKSILEEAKWKAVLVGGSPTQDRLKFYYSKLRFKFYKFLSGKNICKFQIAEKAQARCYTELLKKAISIKADYFIGHNLGALPVVVNAATAQKTKCGFDFEDYHRGEVKNMNKIDKDRIIFLEEKYLSCCNYLSFASPLIAEKTKINFPKYTRQTDVINNCFPLIATKQQKNMEKGLNLFWFSQTVGADRGLLTALQALKILNDASIQLTLVGYASEGIKNDFARILQGSNVQLVYTGMVLPTEIDIIAAQSDVGLALEIAEPENRDLCLTNKIFTYLAAGNAIIFSKTKAQTQFCDSYNAGLLCEINDAEALADCIKFFCIPENLKRHKEHNRKLGQEQLNWEEESKKLLKLITN